MNPSSNEADFDPDDDDLFEGDNLEENEDPDASILGEFINRWENAGEPRARERIIDDFCSRHPRLVDAIRDLVDVRRRVGNLVFADARLEPDPEQLGPYKVVRLLASGGMGRVYEARDGMLQRRLAVKTIRVDRGYVPKLLERFQAECQVLARLHHTNIIPIYNAGEENGLLYFAMPLIKGPNLDDVVAAVSRSRPSSDGTADRTTSWDELIAEATMVSSRRRSMSRLTHGHASSQAPELRPDLRGGPARLPLTTHYFRRVAEIVAVVADALQSAHEVGVVHFDIKPSNILIERLERLRPSPEPGTPLRPVWDRVRGVLANLAERLRLQVRSREDLPQTRIHPVVIDFGLAKPAPTEEDEPSGKAVGAEHGTRRKGTKGFIAPEMLMNRDGAGAGSQSLPALGPPTDVWGLGITLYQLLTLELPFDSEQAVLDPKVRPKPPSELVARLPHELEAVVLKALRKPLEERYLTAAEFAADLRRWLDGVPTVAGKAGPGTRALMWMKRRPATAIAAAMAGALLIVSAFGAVSEINRDRVEAANSRLRAEAAEREVLAKQRELDLLTVQRVRVPVRTMGWSVEGWTKARSLSSMSGPDNDRYLQAQSAATLIEADAHIIATFDRPAEMLEFDSTGARLLMAGAGRDPRNRPITDIRLWDERTQQTQEVTCEAQGVVAFPIAGSPRLLSWNDEDRGVSLVIRDAMSGQKTQILRSPQDAASSFTAIALSHDGAWAAGIAGPLGERSAPEMKTGRCAIVVWETASGKLVRRIELEQTPSYDLLLSPDGRLVAVWEPAGKDREIRVWSVATGQLVGTVPATKTLLSAVAFGRDPVWRDDTNGGEPAWVVAAGESGGEVTIWSLRDQRVRSFLKGSHHDVKTLGFSPDGVYVLSAGRYEARLWNVATGECVLRIPAENYQLGVGWSRDGHRLAVGMRPAFGYPGGVKVIELERGRGTQSLHGLRHPTEQVVVSDNGRRLAALSNDWEIGVWNRETGELEGIAEAPEGFFGDNAAIALNEDGSRLFCSAGQEAKLWDVNQKRLLRKWSLAPAPTEAAGFRPDGRVILVRQETKSGRQAPTAEADPQTNPRVCRAYDLSEQGDPRRLAEYLEFDWYVEHISITFDAAHFAIQGVTTANGKASRIIRVYEGPSGRLIGPIETRVPPGNTATRMRFDPRGTRLHVGDDVGDLGGYAVFEIPTLRNTGIRIDALCVDVGAARGVALRRATGNLPEMILMTERGRPTPLLRIASDTALSGSDPVKFSAAGDFIVWGREDGSVVVSNLKEVQRRLTDIGQGW